VKIQGSSNIFELDTVAAFCRHAPVSIKASHEGPLSGLSYGLKDIYDIAGIPTAFGSPAWLKSHSIPTSTAAFVETLSNAGADLLGKTHTDELTYSILGINAHYGTPINSRSPLRIPGGSSSGSAAAVAAGLVDFAIGSDTGGSVRAPASFCGVYGIRTTHGRISLQHARGLAKSFDALGWFAKDPHVLLQVGEILLSEKASTVHKKPKYFLLKEAFQLAPEPIEAILKKEVGALLSKDLIEEISIAPEALSQWAECFRIVQASEIWEEHGHWAEQHLHEFGPGIKERFEIAKSLDPNVIATAKLEKIRIEKYLKHLLNNLSGETAEAILVTPSTGCIAPLLTTSSLELDQVRKQLFQLLCIAGLGGLPQVNIPICQYENAPLGVSLIANSQQDLFLLHTIQRLSIQQFS
jgi:amidase